MRGCKNEIEHLKSEGYVDPEAKDKQTKVLHEAIRNLQTHLLANRQREMEYKSKIAGLEDRLKKANVKELLLKTKIAGASKGSRDDSQSSDPEESSTEKPMTEKLDDSDEDCVEVVETTACEAKEAINCDDDDVKGSPAKPVRHGLQRNLEAKLVSLCTAYLLIQPHGATLTGLWSYIHQFCASTQPDQVTQVLGKHDELFTKTDNGQWKFVGFAMNRNEDDSKKKEENGEVKY